MPVTRPLIAALLALLAAHPATAHAPAAVDRIVIYKGRHRLEAWAGKRPIAAFRVAIGSGGAGHKRMEGDNRTPEGRYRVVDRRRSRKYGLFLALSYPNAADRAAFARAKRAGKLPASARIGGAIGIHGEKRGWTWLPHQWFDWTRGCVALDDDDIAKLYPLVRVGALVEIRP